MRVKAMAGCSEESRGLEGLEDELETCRVSGKQWKPRLGSEKTTSLLVWQNHMQLPCHTFQSLLKFKFGLCG